MLYLFLYPRHVNRHYYLVKEHYRHAHYLSHHHPLILPRIKQAKKIGYLKHRLENKGVKRVAPTDRNALS
jgi:hypothetical protein